MNQLQLTRGDTSAIKPNTILLSYDFSFDCTLVKLCHVQAVCVHLKNIYLKSLRTLYVGTVKQLCTVLVQFLLFVSYTDQA